MSLINADAYITEAVPRDTEPDEPAEWLAPRSTCGAVAVLPLTRRTSVLLCYRADRWTDEQLAHCAWVLAMSGYQIDGMRGCPRECVEDARSQGALVLLDAPITMMVEDLRIEIDGEPS